MRSNFLISVLAVLFVASFLGAQTTVVPDANFEEYLETHNLNGGVVAVGDDSSMGDGVANNGLVLTNRINNVISLVLNGLSINDLTGIEDFVSLENLICNGNNLISLNISNNINLKSLLCSSNRLTTLNITSNTNLEDLDCSNNQISTLNVGNNLSLKILNCSNNKISDVDVSQNVDLNSLRISKNRISDLVLTNNTNLESLYCASNQISTLNLSTNTNLKVLDASNNLISALDLSTINSVLCPDPQTDPVTSCQGGSTINVSNNKLTSLIVANGFNDLITSFKSQNNPDLFCVQVDADFTPNANWTKDDWTYYAETTCTDIYTYVPDDNFEAYLEANGLGDGTNDNNLVLTSIISSELALNISNQNIDDLTGIEDFTALQTLNCSTNNLDKINLTNNTALINFNGSNNNLSNLDLSNNNGLSVLDISFNSLSDLEISNNLSITNLNCSNNSIRSLNLSNHASLTDFNCDSNALEVLNIQNGQNGNLANFSAINNVDLSCIETDTGTVPAGVTWTIDATASYAVNCGTYVPDDAFENYLETNGLGDGIANNNYVSTASANTFTGSLNIAGSGIADLTGIQDFVVLTVLNCSNNNIAELNLITNSALTSLTCNNNTLEFVDIRNGNNTNLTTFNATNNTNLFCINVDASVIGNIPGSWVKDPIASYNDDCANNRYTAIPDNNFEQALIDLGIDSGVLDNQVLTANIEYLKSLNVSGENIESLEGIKAFLSLTELDCSSNYLDELDVSGMVNLENLYCGSNYFLTNNTANANGLLNTTGTISLTKLFCANNNLADLNISLNTNLEVLDCSNNDLSILDISNNNNLTEVNCNSNQITNLFTATVNNNSLIKLSCSSNTINTLLVTNYLALTTLNCRSNTLTQLDITSNGALEVLDFSDNDLTDINLSGKTKLIAVSGSQNDLTDVDDLLSPVLESLILDSNQINQLTTVLTNLSAIKYLSISDNQLTDLNASSNNNLIELNVSNNQITSLQLPTNLNQLKTFNCSNNQITGDFDLTTMGIAACPTPNQNNPLDFCPDSITINVSGNQLEFVNIQNGINSDILNFNSSNNPDLSCVQVDDVNNIGVNWFKDATTEYGLDCKFGQTYVPDDNFEQTLITFGYDTGALDDYVPTANIEVIIDLDISGNNITDLTGIEDFAALQNLDFSNNVISSVDLTQNTNLIQINCSSNALASLDLSNNTNVIDVNISNNAFTEFDASLIPMLQIFNCDSNQIMDLDLQQNTALTSLSCQSNQLESLNLKNGQNPNLANLNAQNNATLTCIETDNGVAPGGVTWLKDATANYSMNCHYGETYVPDDAFEQALISLGFDSGTLDDYVLTANIENLSTLNIGNQNISDLTGIEDFLGLTNFNFEGNTVNNVDLSNNIFLASLNASSNAIPTIDLSANTSLVSLNISNNNISQINLDSNTSLVTLNVSGNMLTELNVDALINLRILNCSENQLSALQVILNQNLQTLSCQSNLFISDQLNIQNGNNENLTIFNATNNPDLLCILVDDPFTVITNADGSYDGWFKDSTANYQSICNDADNDGVANADDQCPNTPFGDSVDLFGCSILSLTNNNFTILITGETCLNNNNGKINITTLEYYNYTATLTGDDFNKEYHFTNEIDILNLLAGSYQLCITIAEFPEYESCYTVVITQPEPLDVSTGKSSNGKKVSIDLSGSTSYNIEFNGLKFKTTDAYITLSLQNGKNSIKVSTDLECQGIYEESILVSDDLFVYPNPFQEKVNVHLGNIDKEHISISVYSYLGQLVYNKALLNYKSNTISIDTATLNVGLYTVSVQSKTSLSTFKIVKK
ncbi:T9SS type A sorting domain-containing protein [Sabulilitoribacter multivorans]|uniref:T9SS type A sorting domain-containing protein n=1 Tax=Flaviramulus multivorans TaxID=1304750 RepID=A0ABS9IIZ7_9FLAO|nr:T9SS type A sorting domain-containing protein [Flaviramulus multivorans]MCF7560245.1 T9SS type A sorting domain-containing protein [Flaviramulus multivorans]